MRDQPGVEYLVFELDLCKFCGSPVRIARVRKFVDQLLEANTEVFKEETRC